MLRSHAENFLGPELAHHPVTEEMFFQQDGATGTSHWPARSPDLSACDFFLWGYLKSQVFKAPAPHIVQELKH